GQRAEADALRLSESNHRGLFHGETLRWRKLAVGRDAVSVVHHQNSRPREPGPSGCATYPGRPSCSCVSMRATIPIAPSSQGPDGTPGLDEAPRSEDSAVPSQPPVCAAGLNRFRGGCRRCPSRLARSAPVSPLKSRVSTSRGRSRPPTSRRSMPAWTTTPCPSSPTPPSTPPTHPPSAPPPLP